MRLTKGLQAVYDEIDALEKTKIDVKEFSSKEELYHLFALAAFICLLCDVVLRNTVLRSIP